jgi:hypothetical protein
LIFLEIRLGSLQKIALSDEKIPRSPSIHPAIEQVYLENFD